MAQYHQLFQQADRQQQLADAMLQKSMQSRAPQQTGRIASEMGWGEGLAQLGEAMLARRQGKKASATTAQADEQRRQAQAAALAGMSGRPEHGEGPPAPVNPYAQAQGALEADVHPAVVQQYMAQQQPDKNGLINNIDPEAYEPESVQAFVSSGGKDYSLLKPRANMYGKYNPGDYTPESWAEFRQTGDERVLKRFAANRIVSTAGGGTMAVNPMDPTNPLTVVSDEAGTRAAADKAGAEAQAKAIADAQGKALGAYMAKASSAQGVLEILDMAEPIIDVATGSATGAIRDKVASWFGVSTDGAQGVAQLAPLQAALMMAMPRMEGPQSDKDVQLYRDAAGQIGDPNIPAETKKAALQLIRQLNQKYQQRGYQPGVTPIIPNSAVPAAPSAASGAVDWNSL
jgi:hypothetical protein